jgi:hypothetical protein
MRDDGSAVRAGEPEGAFRHRQREGDQIDEEGGAPHPAASPAGYEEQPSQQGQHREKGDRVSAEGCGEKKSHALARRSKGGPPAAAEKKEGSCERGAGKSPGG